MLRVIILIVAVSAGGLCAWLLLTSNNQTEVAQPVAPSKAMEVLVAASDLPQGQVVSEKDLRWQQWPSDAVAATYITRANKPDAVTALKGSMARTRFVAGEPIQEQKMSRTPSGMLASLLPSGKRAVAVRVSAESAAGGFILPNDRVDVIHTSSKAGQLGDLESASKTILTNIKVLAIDQRANDIKDPVFVGKTATLELDSDQAEVLAAGQVGGTLSLALRSYEDKNIEASVHHKEGASIQVFHGVRIDKVRVQ
jgi:pilus assembly protein CpaB